MSSLPPRRPGRIDRALDAFDARVRRPLEARVAAFLEGRPVLARRVERARLLAFGDGTLPPPRYLPWLLFVGMAGGLARMVPDSEATLLLATLALGGLVVASWIRPGAGILGAIFLLAVFIPLSKAFTGIKELMLLPDAIVYCLALSLLVRGPAKPLSRAAVVALACWTLFFLVSVLQTRNNNVPGLRTGLEGFRKTALTSAALPVALYVLRGPADFFKVARWIAVGYCVAGLYAVKQEFFWSSFDSRIVEASAAGTYTGLFAGKPRAVGFFSGPFHLAVSGLQLFGLGAVFLARAAARADAESDSRSRARRFGSFSLGDFFERHGGLVMMGLGAAAVLVSHTRTNLAGLAVVGGVYLTLTARTPARMFLVQGLAGIALLGLFLLMALGGGGTYRRAVRSLMNPMSDTRFLGRYIHLKDAIQSADERPFLAWGMGSAGDALDKPFLGRVHYTTHNMGLKVLIETGFPGLVGFLGMILVWGLRFLHGLGGGYAARSGDGSHSARDALEAGRDTGARGGDDDPLLAQLAAGALVMPVLFNGIANSGIETYPMNLFMWFGIGAACVLPPHPPLVRAPRAHASSAPSAPSPVHPVHPVHPARSAHPA